VFSWRRSRVIFHVLSYSSWPAIEFRLRIHWAESRKRLKLSVPTVFRRGTLICEIPGGAIERPADGNEHVFGRWALVEGEIGGRRRALAVVTAGPHGLDYSAGALRLSVLRSAAYCHERGFHLQAFPWRKFMDQGEHEVRFLLLAGEPRSVRRPLAALADWLAAPPFALAHLPFGGIEERNGRKGLTPGLKDQACAEKTEGALFSCRPPNIRVTACKRSRDRRSLIIRLHETAGEKTNAVLRFDFHRVQIRLDFRPFEIKTLRLERSGDWREVGMISETVRP